MTRTSAAADNRALTDGSGTVQNTYQYDAYGSTTSSTGSVTNPFRYAGEYRDSESGFYYLRARYYDPSTQQFLSRDPLLPITGQAYNYANGSPTNWTDPSGLRLSVGLLGDGDAGGGGGDFVVPIAIGLWSLAVVAASNLGTALRDWYDSSRPCLSTPAAEQETTTVSARRLGRYSGDKRTAREIIAEEKEGSILREFPGEWLDRSPDDIYKEAQKGNARARKAKKLLDRGRYGKD